MKLFVASVACMHTYLHTACIRTGQCVCSWQKVQQLDRNKRQPSSSLSFSFNFVYKEQRQNKEEKLERSVPV